MSVKTKKTGLVNEVNSDLLKKNNSIYFILLLFVILITIFIRIHFLDIPFERDEGSYMYSGKTILDGAIPFKDIGSQRLPGVFYAYAGMVFIFGYSIKAIHVGFLIVNLLTIVILFLIGKKVFNSLCGLATAASFSLLSMTPHASGFTIQSEHLVALTGFSGILSLLYYMDKGKIYLLITSGLLLSFAFQIKQTSMFYVFFCATILLYHFFSSRPMNWKKVIAHLTIYSISFLAPLAFSIFWIWKQGAFADFKLWMFDITAQYTSVISFSDGLTYLKYSLTNITKNYTLLWILSFAGILFIFFTKETWYKKFIGVILFVFSFLTVVPGNHYYGHYFLQFIPAVAFGVGIFVYSVENFLRTKLNLKAVSTVVALLILTLAYGGNLAKQKNYYFKPNHTKILREVYGLNPFPESWVICKYLNQQLKEEDKIVVFGTEIQTYVYTNKISPSRFAGSGVLVEFPVKQQKEWQQEYIKDVEKANPKYVILYAHPISWMTNPKSEKEIFNWIDKFTREKYDMIGYADIYSDQTLYVWGKDEIMKRPPNPKSQYKIIIYQKRA